MGDVGVVNVAVFVLLLLLLLESINLFGLL